MTRKILFTALVGAGLALSSVAFLALARTPSEPIPEGTQTLSLEVRGMQSLMCEMGVKSALKQLDGVEAVTVDRANAAVQVSFDPAKASPSSFTHALNGAGFQARLPAGFETSESRPVLMGGAHLSASSQLSSDQIELVTDFIAGHILETEEIPDGETIEKATGVELSIGDTPILQQAVLARLADDPRGQKLLAGSRCSDYGACSVWGNLSGADGSVLALYEQEKTLDGQKYEDRDLPIFGAVTLAGEAVSSADLVGQPLILVLLSVHCNHSMDTFPILEKLHQRYGEQGVQVVGVLVNSGSLEDARQWIPHFSPEYPIWVSEGDGLGDLVGSHLVPTYLLVDGQGKVRELLVGYRDQASVEAELELIQARVS